MNAGTAAETGITGEDVQSLLVAVATLVGTSRTSPWPSGAPRLGFVIELAIAELAAEDAAAEAADER